MGKNIDDLKGRIKEAAGDITDDKDLKNKGKIDRLSGKAKDAADELPVNGEKRVKIEEGIDKMKEKAQNAVDRS